ncbi:hypothetical protein MVEN_01408800 [Mycena venus]|uniref:Uncharacterized protein n=1 Tax=Mycena venus TaxID=2733690 RepID=A0A8H6XYG8_9AGAR|nr:hypothetical protein MVEN_01408800 [Mycena venus]
MLIALTNTSEVFDTNCPSSFHCIPAGRSPSRTSAYLFARVFQEHLVLSTDENESAFTRPASIRRPFLASVWYVHLSNLQALALALQRWCSLCAGLAHIHTTITIFFDVSEHICQPEEI